MPYLGRYLGTWVPSMLHTAVDCYGSTCSTPYLDAMYNVTQGDRSSLPQHLPPTTHFDHAPPVHCKTQTPAPAVVAGPALSIHRLSDCLTAHG